MFGKAFHLFTAFGFPIRLDASWFLIAILITWSLASGVFPQFYEGLSTATYWTMGVAGALGLFASVVVHELAHAIVARRNGMRMRGITLFIFGGVAEMQDEPPSARAEFLVAIAGPIASILVALVFWGVGALASAAGAAAPAMGVLLYLALINGMLVVFNMIPAFPLDGGRVLRSALWKWKDDLQRATRISSEIGSGFGLVLIVLGVMTMIGGNFIGGFWWILIGMFLRSAAQMSYQQVLIRRVLQGEPVSRFMQREVHTAAPDISLADFVNDYVFHYHHKLYPVLDNGELLGCVMTRDLRKVPREQWPETPVRNVVEPCSSQNTIQSEEDAVAALGRLHRAQASRLMVLEGDRLVGVVSLKDMLKFLSLKIELESDIDSNRVPAIVGAERFD